MSPLILAVDQGTTSTRAIIFDLAFRAQATAQIPLGQSYPEPGWVEHDPEEIWRATLQVCREALSEVGGADRVAAVGLTNQRETTVVWDRRTGEAVHPAIVWQDRRTADLCRSLRDAGREAEVQARTGLLLDPYFSATKIAWILDRVPGARARAEAGALAAGTIDSFLLWRLTGGGRHATDATNASRWSLLDLRTMDWDESLLALFRAPRAILPEVVACTGPFGETAADLFGRPVPITGVAGDQHAALVGHGALRPGEVKITYGTGAFLMAHAGAAPPRSTHRLLATAGYVTGRETAYALEGSIFSAGSTVQWLKEGLGLIGASRDSEALAQSLPDNGGVYLVPGFTGLGAPWWEPDARGSITGLTRDATAAHLVRAGLEALAYQTADLLAALAADGARPSTLKVDGGVTANAWAMQFLSDVCDLPVERPAFQELTALGAAKLAALGAGLVDDLAAVRAADVPTRWTPRMAAADRDRLLAGWRAAVAGTLAAARG